MTRNDMMVELPACRDIVVTHAQISDIGGRASNQDALGMAAQDDLACFVVSDGAGGHEGGEIAANLVVKAVIDSFTRDLSFSPRALQSYVQQAVADVAQGKSGAGPQDMSATVAALLIDQTNRCAIWAHLGDTRVYLFRSGAIQQVTKDHSVVQQFIDAGYCKPEDARTHPQRSMLFAAIGAEGDTAPAVTAEPLAVQDGDAFLICTDGFWEWVPESEMERALARATSVQQWLESMRQYANISSRNSAKSRDNSTAIALWMGRSAARTGAGSV